MNTKKIIGSIVLVVVMLALGGAGGYVWAQSTKSQEIDMAKQTARLEALQQASREKTVSLQEAEAKAKTKVSTEATCNADELSLAAAIGDAAAGTVSYNLTLTNTSKRTCTLGGFPGVSLVNANGNIVGSPAERATNYAEKKLTLAPNQKIKAIVSVSQPGNFTNGKCKAGATKLRVYPPNDSGYLSVASPIDTWCPGFVTSPVLAV